MNSIIRFYYTIATMVISAVSNHAFCQGLKIPSGDDGIADFISDSLPTQYTPDELASPPAGEIRKLRLRDINATKAALQAVLSSVPSVDQVNPNYSIALSAMQKIESVISDRQQDQLFGLIEDIIVLNRAAENEVNPSFVKLAAEAIGRLKTCIVHEIATYVVAENAVVTNEKLSLFVKALIVGSFIEAGDWEDKVMPVSGIEMMMLDAVAVVSLLKSQPWQDAERFIGGATAAEAFSRYTPPGDGSAVLKSKYASNQSTIDAKWNELAAWVAAQRSGIP
jgi:hypothetical protein